MHIRGLATLLVLTVTATLAAATGVSAAAERKACKLLKPAAIEKVLGAPAARSDTEGTQVAGAESCGYDVAPGLGEPGGALVVVSYFSGPVASGVGADIKTRAEAISHGAVWDPLVDAAYVIKSKRVVGVSVTYTSSDPPAEELKPEMAKLAKAAFKRS
jgi:hypothetical protein